MESKAMETLALLAVKLGTTIEEMWPLLVKYTMVWYSMSILVSIGALVLDVWAVRFAIKKHRAVPPHSGQLSDDSNEARVAWLIASALLVLGGVALAYSIGGDVAILLNPEAKTLYYLLGKCS